MVPTMYGIALKGLGDDQRWERWQVLDIVGGALMPPCKDP